MGANQFQWLPFFGATHLFVRGWEVKAQGHSTGSSWSPTSPSGAWGKTPLKNMMDFVNWDDDSNPIFFWEHRINGNQTTNQPWYTYRMQQSLRKSLTPPTRTHPNAKIGLRSSCQLQPRVKSQIAGKPKKKHTEVFPPSASFWQRNHLTDVSRWFDPHSLVRWVH